MSVIGAFTVFDRTGAPFNFQIAADGVSAFEAEKGALLDRGYALTPPPEGMEPQSVRVTGWVLGEANDKYAGRFMPCVYLYGEKEALQFAAATVYHERLGELPVKVEGAKVWNGAAPKRQEAKQRGFFRTCDFVIELVPEIDYATGQPRRSEKGNIRYAYSRVLGESAQGEPGGTDQGEPEDVDFYPDQPLPTFATLYREKGSEFSEPERKIIAKLIEMDQGSDGPLKPPVYKQLRKDLDAAVGRDWGLPVLECCLGRSIKADTLPGDRVGAVSTWLLDPTRGDAVKAALQAIQGRCAALQEQMPLFD